MRAARHGSVFIGVVNSVFFLTHRGCEVVPLLSAGLLRPTGFSPLASYVNKPAKVWSSLLGPREPSGKVNEMSFQYCTKRILVVICYVHITLTTNSSLHSEYKYIHVCGYVVLVAYRILKYFISSV